MKVAAFNVENLFNRAKIFNQDNDSLSSDVQRLAGELNTLFNKANYTAEDKSEMIRLMHLLKLSKSDTGEYVLLRQIREKVVKRPNNASMEIIAGGREEWIGWVELKTEHVNETAMMNTGRVIRDVNADILVVIEAEGRISLKKFCDNILTTVSKEIDIRQPDLYQEVMLIDGNDERGIDVGIMVKNGFEIGSIKSHIDDRDSAGKTIFSRDCPEYQIITPSGETVWLLPNHFKSKYGGDNAPSKKRRKAQAERTAQIYIELIGAGHKYIIVLGDLNDTPDSATLQPLLSTGLQDVSLHPTFDPGEYQQIGTYGSGTNSNKIDYLLLSPDLFSKVTGSGLFRKGAYPGLRPKKWTVYPELTKKVQAASDHHLIWADINI